MVDTQTTTLGTIQQQLSLLVNLTVHNPPQPTTATPSQTVNLPPEQPLPPRPAAQPTQGRTSLKPAAPSEFDGSRHKGRAFLNSCELYMNLALQQFTSKTSKVHWALSYMKAGRASLYTDRVLWYKAKNGVPWYLSWFAFWEDFVKTFCPKSEAQRALTQLETAEYHQGRQTVDKYTDEFRDLIELAGYTDRLASSLNSTVDCHGKSRTRSQQCLWGDPLMTNRKTGMKLRHCVMKTKSPMQPSSLQNRCPLGIQLWFSGCHRCFRPPHHELHLCRHRCHLYPVSRLWSQWMLMQFDRGQLTHKPVTSADNQVTFVVTAHFVMTPAT
jgi:hypothetical protein